MGTVGAEEGDSYTDEHNDFFPPGLLRNGETFVNPASFHVTHDLYNTPQSVASFDPVRRRFPTIDSAVNGGPALSSHQQESTSRSPAVRDARQHSWGDKCSHLFSADARRAASFGVSYSDQQNIRGEYPSRSPAVRDDRQGSWEDTSQPTRNSQWGVGGSFPKNNPVTSNGSTCRENQSRPEHAAHSHEQEVHTVSDPKTIRNLVECDATFRPQGGGDETGFTSFRFPSLAHNRLHKVSPV